MNLISTHTPHTGCDVYRQYGFDIFRDFNSHTPHGVRPEFGIYATQPFNFNSHTPHGVRPSWITIAFCCRRRFQLTHPTRGATETCLICRLTRYHFNSHTPHGVRLNAPYAALSRLVFQLTHPTRGATFKANNFIVLFGISTHTPHTGCDGRAINKNLLDIFISTHTPHTGCDLGFFAPGVHNQGFQLTHPTRGATLLKKHRKYFDKISTHTPHTGCDA